VTHEFTDAEWAAFEEEVWQAEQAAIKDAVTAAVKPHVDYEDSLTHSLGTWQLVSVGEGALVIALALALIFHK
jgi:hypothetical protein